jgi:hypothetical protein
VAQRVLPITIVLTPLEEPEEIRGEAALFRPGFTLISGWAVDTDGKPLANVHIRLDGGRAEEQTNARGYYALSVPSPLGRTVAGIDFPAKGNVIAELPGYKTFVARNIYLPGGADFGLNIELERGTGTVEHDFLHKLDPDNLGSKGLHDSEPR